MKREKKARKAGTPKLAALLATLFVVVAPLALNAADGPQGVVNVNQATVEQLQLLPGVGPALAKRIADFREKNGRFEAIEDLIAVRGIGERKLEAMRPYVTLEGPTTLSQKVRLPRKKSRAK